jgi:carbonic anhydrase
MEETMTFANAQPESRSSPMKLAGGCLRPAVELAGPNLEATIKANAKMQAALLRQASPVLAGYIKQNQLKIVAAYYDLASGRVTILD